MFSSLADLFVANFNPVKVVLTLVIALLIGLYIFMIYKKSFGGVLYSRNFNLSLVMLTLVTAVMLMSISTNLTLSMGMVGALSIIRFRTAVKDPMDTVFMFWAVGEGIAIGTGFFDLAVISSILIGIFVLIFSAGKPRGGNAYLLILHYSDFAGETVKKMVKQLPNARLKSKVVRQGGVEMTLELRLKENETGFVEKFLRVEGVQDASLISHQGDIIG